MSGIHGDEPVTGPLAQALTNAAIPDDLTVSIVPSTNPDGWASGTRRNARGVDLNRNFPWRWRSSDGGPRPASEVETRAMMNVIETERPDLVVWIHQPLAWVAALGRTPRRYAQVWAETVGDPVRANLDQHGGGETWTERVANVPSILVEVATWGSSDALVNAHRLGFEALAAVIEPAR
jgi:protein MpaA